MAQGSSPLSRFELNGVEEKGREIGRGSYAVVEELDFRGLSCVGKSIHEELYDNASDRERVDMLARFGAECELLSQVRHPNVVQFVGVHFKQGSSSRLPVLVMERLDSTLSDCLDRYEKLPNKVSYPIVRDVAVGLRYLHGYTPSPIVHRDLTANNVLLTSDMKAKISDLGVAKILNLNPARMAQMTTCPGTPSYMPPEALVTKPIYTTKVDIFAYGNLMTHVFSGVWPIPTAVFRVDPSNPNVMVPATEVERREEYLQNMGDTHPLIALTCQCLSNNPLTRPEAPEILAHINEVMPQFPPSFQNTVEMLRRIEADHNEKRTLNSQIEEHQRQIEEKDRQTAHLEMSHSLETHTRVSELTSEIESLRMTIRAKEELISSKQQQVLAAQDVATASHLELSTAYQQLAAKDQVLSAKDRQLSTQQSEISALREEIANKEAALEAKDSIIMRIRSQTSQSLLFHPHSRLRWRKGADLPEAMYTHHIVRIRNNVYCGGGYTSSIDTSQLVFRYDCEQDKWSPLPICPTRLFGLTQLDGKLVIVGGRTPNHTTYTVNDVYVFEESQTWEKSIPPLPTARFYPTTFAYKSTLVVIGGVTHWNTDSAHSTRTSAVEVFRSKSSQWYCAEPLPLAHSSMSPAIINDTCYLIGGTTGSASRQGYCTSVPSLIETAVPPDHLEGASTISQILSSPLTWHVLPECPFCSSTAAELGGCLLAIGGKDDSDSPSSAVHVYSPSTNSWVRISTGDLPVPRYFAATTQLTTGEIIFVGGKDEQNFTVSVFAASIEL